MGPKKNSGFTLLEILIVVSLLAVIGAAIIIFLNPMQQIKKAWDSKKKSDLNVLKKSFEDYYNDKNCYPTLEKVCYNAKSEYAPNEAKTCNICGNNPLSPSFTPYLTTLPCDPESPKSEFLYQVDDLSCPKWFKVYSELGYKIDPVISELGCSAEACGIAPDYGYDFGVSSPNTGLNASNYFWCLSSTDNKCNQCGDTLTDCQGAQTCSNNIFSNYADCCEANDTCNPKHCTEDILNGGCINCGNSYVNCYATGRCVEKSASPGSCP